jgi:hypothetical protein
MLLRSRRAHIDGCPRFFKLGALSAGSFSEGIDILPTCPNGLLMRERLGAAKHGVGISRFAHSNGSRIPRCPSQARSAWLMLLKSAPGFVDLPRSTRIQWQQLWNSLVLPSAPAIRPRGSVTRRVPARS